ncbi:hypothetical protein CPB83DRAFT_856240 [Crepidotus variabilis]|uniref:Uncharacterized protein n=1 Tax=Crepidotus variabilis TaxID=179855 RepID=A0A9P6EEL2_9AGAR|nr:hypothetical protein CPB83DRAFT_856240 [Crepidotus variabilis]
MQLSNKDNLTGLAYILLHLFFHMYNGSVASFWALHCCSVHVDASTMSMFPTQCCRR